MAERRQHVRVVGPFEGHWHGGSGATECRISDVGLGGCFVETVLQPGQDEETDVTIRFSDGHEITLPARVIYVDPGVGFGVQFRSLTPDETETLKKYLHQDT